MKAIILHSRGPDGPRLILTKRSSHLKHHPGQIGAQPVGGYHPRQRHQPGAQRRQRQTMRPLGVAAMQGPEAQRLGQAQITPSGKIWPVAPSGRDLSQTTSDRRRRR